ncbi:DUF2194 domain-containing protein [Acetivibrio ethanolgignens]|uniref:DUF2194 domain-containing protein n=1 Tax=Acetivibrio ethanolgignens TaxID=290052 RepID=A0A0V8QG27_9FIRM|nr:DUF2194 domain-containing protein [Acetivibrio ethanolgignens]KSV59472.1 hypothetical protein ASU35_08630 [Acetivibrio ethanolgignens]
MKILKKPEILRKNQLGRHLFLYIVAVLFLMLLIFTTFSNLKYFLVSTKKMEEKAAEHKRVVDAVEAFKETEKIKAQDKREQMIYLWGNQTIGCQITEAQLENMKMSYVIKEELINCKDAFILFVCQASFSESELITLDKWNKKGMIIFFTQIPEEEQLRKKSLLKLLGIESYKGIEGERGVRLSEALLFGEIAESKEKIRVKKIELENQTEVYAQTLEKDIPLFWRYKQSVDSGSIYVADKSLFEKKTGYAVISFLLEDVYESYMYPIVNAYCFMVVGMPYEEYTGTASEEYLESVYGKNALGVENDIFFPEIRRCEDRYGLKATWYTSQKKEIKTTTNPLIQYYIKNIEKNYDEIGEWNLKTGKKKVPSEFDNVLKEWSPEFRWLENEQVQIPYMNISTADYRTVLVENLSGIKGLGFTSSVINIDEFLDEESSADWIDFSNNLESVLGTEKQEIFWLDRVSAREAVYRIRAFEVMEPRLSYTSEGIDIQIDFFADAAYFYLRTKKEIIEALNAEVTEISDNLYLIKITKERAKIEFQG